jgi:hypothetical protein
MTVSLLEIEAAARAHSAPLAAESAGYLMLGVADRLLEQPRSFSPQQIELESDGSLRLLGQAPASAGGDGAQGAEKMLRSLLDRLLCVSSSVGPALRRAAERKEELGLPALVRELETALIPVNRAAAKRALSRLHRDTERARASGRLSQMLPQSAPARAPAALEAADPEEHELAPLPPVTSAPRTSRPELFDSELAAAAPAPAFELVAAVPDLSPPSPRGVMRAPEPESITRPEPVVARARGRQHSTPKLGTRIVEPVVTQPQGAALALAQPLQCAPELGELTDRMPGVEIEPSPLASLANAAAGRAPQLEPPSPSPSVLPNVVQAMAELYSSLDHEAETLLRVATRVSVAEDVDCAPLVAAGATSAPEPMPPHVPAELPQTKSDVSELVKAFSVSDAPTAAELRGTLKQLAGLELTPMPAPFFEKG